VANSRALPAPHELGFFVCFRFVSEILLLGSFFSLCPRRGTRGARRGSLSRPGFGNAGPYGYSFSQMVFHGELLFCAGAWLCPSGGRFSGGDGGKRLDRCRAVAMLAILAHQRPFLWLRWPTGEKKIYHPISNKLKLPGWWENVGRWAAGSGGAWFAVEAAGEPSHRCCAGWAWNWGPR